MISHVKSFLMAGISIITLDFIWLNYLAKNIYTQQIGKFFSYTKDNQLIVNYPAAVGVYILLIVGIMFFVLPKANNSLQALLYGGLFGGIVYGVYDFTNLAIIQGWPVPISFIDMAWGSTVCAATSLITFLLL